MNENTRNNLVNWINANINSHEIYVESILDKLSMFGFLYNKETETLSYKNNVSVLVMKCGVMRSVWGLHIVQSIAQALDVFPISIPIHTINQYKEVVDTIKNMKFYN